MPVIINGSTGISGTDGSAATPAVQGTDGNTGMFFPAADQIAFAEGGTEVMRLDAAGNVGIGVTTPTGFGSPNLHINGTGPLVHFTNSSVGTAAGNGAQIGIAGSVDAQFVNLQSGALILGTSGAERMRLDADGRVGIATSSPRAQISVRGGQGAPSLSSDANNISLTTSNTSVELAQGAYSSPIFAYWMQVKQDVNSGVAWPLAIQPIGGNVTIGSASNPTGSRLSVNTSSAQNVICAESNSAGMTHFLVTTTLSSAGGSDAFAAYDAGPGIAARISTNGFYQSRPNSYGSTSDIKLKENVVDASPKLPDLMRVRVRNYNYKDDPNLKQIGVIAQELEPVFPGLVYETQDRDASGTDLGTTTKNVKYSVFVPMLIKALQEQQVQIEELKARVAALEAR